MTPVQQFILTLISIIIAGVSVLAAFVTIFFQFFHKPKRIRIIMMPLGKKYKTLRFGICNGGKVNIYITSLSVNYSWITEDSFLQECSAGTVSCTKSLLSPDDIEEHSLDLYSPPERIREIIPLRENEQGIKERKLDILAFIQFAFPDGKIYSNKLKLGEHTISEDESATGFSIHGINMDLLENALPVKTKN